MTSSALWSALSTAVTIPVLALSTVIIARTLGPTGFGHVALYTFAITLCSGLIDLGIPFALQRKGAIAAGSGDIAGVVSYSRAAAMLSLLQLMPMLLVGFVVLPSRDSFALFALTLIAWYPFKGAGYYLGMTSLLKVPSQVRAGSTILSACTAVLVAVLTRRGDLTFAAGFFCLNAFESLLLLGVPQGLRRAVLRPGKLLLSRKDMLFALSDVLGGQLDAIVFQQSEVAFFGRSQGVARGQYSVAQTIGARSTLLLDALLGPISVGLINAWGRGEQALHRAFRLASDAIVMLFLITCPAGLALIAVVSGPLFGHSFKGVAQWGVLLTAASLIQTSFGPIIGLCTARRRIVPLMASSGFAAVVDIALAALLVRPLGLAGAILTAVAAQATYGVLLVWLLGTEHEERRLGAGHAIRCALVVAYCAVPAVLTLPMPRLWAYVVALPMAIVWTTFGLRTPAIRGTRSLAEIASHLPTRVQSLVTRPLVLRLFDGAPER